jgi:hypothetical protein
MFRLRAEGVDGEALAAEVRRAVEEKKRAGVLTEDEVREIAGRRLDPVLEAHDLRSTLLAEVLEPDSRWNYTFEPEAIYRSSRGGLLERVRRLLRPVQKLFWNPTPMISALSRQSEINAAQAHVIHNLVLEVTRLNLEVRDLKNRALQLQGRLDQLARRGKTVEAMAFPGGDEPSPR